MIFFVFALEKSAPGELSVSKLASAGLCCSRMQPRRSNLFQMRFQGKELNPYFS